MVDGFEEPQGSPEILHVAEAEWLLKVLEAEEYSIVGVGFTQLILEEMASFKAVALTLNLSYGLKYLGLEKP